MTCKFCGTELPENAKFCPGCAAKIEQDGLDVILTEGKTQSLDTPLPIEKVYNLLECDKYYNEKTGITAFTNSFKINPAVYRVAGMKPFSQRSDEIKSRLEKWCADWVQKAEDEWRRTSLEKVTKFKSAITALSSQFCKAIDEKFKEQLSLLSTIKSLGLDAKDLRKKVTGFIESYAKSHSPASMDDMLKVMDIQGVSFKSPAKIFKIQAEECLAKKQVNPNEPLDEKGDFMKAIKVIKKIGLGIFLLLIPLSCAKKDKDTETRYTFRVASSSPSTWSPTDQSMGDEDAILKLISTYLYDFVMNDEKNSYTILPELAADMPLDVTSEWAGKEPYGIPEGESSGYAWKIELVKDAVWDNGSPITADDVEYSIQQYLNPKMKNYRANSFYQDSLPLANAKAYYDGGVSWDDVMTDSAGPSYSDAKDSEMYFSLTNKCAFFGDTLQNVHSTNPDYFTDKNGKDLFKELSSIIKQASYVHLTDEAKDIFLTISANCGDGRPVSYKEFCFTRTEVPPMEWSNVGFIKNDDHTFTLVLNKKLSPFMIIYSSTSLRLVRKDLYEANKKKTGDIEKSSYGTSLESSASYGPYKISAFQADKYIHLEKNPLWFGYSDGKHKGHYMTTDIDIQFISDLETLTNLFLQGKMDVLSLDAVRLEKYGSSEYRYDFPQSYTWKFSFDTDKRALKAEESPGINHSILAYKDFRKGISLSLDRQKYVDTIGIGSDAGYGLINYLYVAVPETGELFRDTPQAKQALCDFYGSSSIEDITGYNKEEAKNCMQKAYDAAIKAGDLKESDKIELDYHIYNENNINTRSVAFLQNAIDEATKGTGLEAKVTIKPVVDENYYANLKSGKADIAMTGWGGGAFDPYGVLWCYCVPDVVNEYGFHPDTEKLTININGNDETRTYYDWYNQLCNGLYTDSSSEIKNTILAQVEKGLLEYYIMIPLRYWNAIQLHSQRVVEGSDHYINQLVEYGDLRFRTYTMNDKKWDDYCKENNYQLKY